MLCCAIEFHGGVELIERVRVAFGTGVVLGLWRGQLEVPPTTAHFLTYHEGRCSANCKFCPQARESTADLRMLSRVIWPAYELRKVLTALAENSNEFERVCIQAVSYPKVVDDLCTLVGGVKSACRPPISVSCQPLKREDMERLADAGAERVCVALDAATPELFERLKGGPGDYRWGRHLKALEDARSIFGDRVSTHLIIGLGETEREAVESIQLLHDRRITVALFAFTPIRGTPLAGEKQPDVVSYRRVQLARYLIVKGLATADGMRFEGGRISDFGVQQDVLNRTVELGEPFRSSGCPGCNRPFYNESPRGPIYNYPRKPTSKEIAVIRGQLGQGVGCGELLPIS